MVLVPAFNSGGAKKGWFRYCRFLVAPSPSPSLFFLSFRVKKLREQQRSRPARQSSPERRRFICLFNIGFVLPLAGFPVVSAPGPAPYPLSVCPSVRLDKFYF